MGVLKVQAQQRNPRVALQKPLERNHFGPGNACTGRGGSSAVGTTFGLLNGLMDISSRSSKQSWHFWQS